MLLFLVLCRLLLNYAIGLVLLCKIFEIQWRNVVNFESIFWTNNILYCFYLNCRCSRVSIAACCFEVFYIYFPGVSPVFVHKGSQPVSNFNYKFSIYDFTPSHHPIRDVFLNWFDKRYIFSTFFSLYKVNLEYIKVSWSKINFYIYLYINMILVSSIYEDYFKPLNEEAYGSLRSM